MKTKPTYTITLFHCINACGEPAELSCNPAANLKLNIIPMACSSMTKDIFLLKAFEAGADAVMVLVCPEAACRFAEGSIRAKKRVDWVKAILDEIGLGSGRLSIHNVTPKDAAGIQAIVEQTLATLATLGPSPAAANHTSTSPVN